MMHETTVHACMMGQRCMTLCVHCNSKMPVDHRRLSSADVNAHVVYVLVERVERWQLDSIRDCHVVLDRVQSTQDQVEDADGVPQGVGQLLNDNRKAAEN